MRANNQKVYTPHEGKLVSDINRVSKIQSFIITALISEAFSLHLSLTVILVLMVGKVGGKYRSSLEFYGAGQEKF